MKIFLPLFIVLGIWGWGTFLGSFLSGYQKRSPWQESALGWAIGIIAFYYLSILHFSFLSFTGVWLFRFWLITGSLISIITVLKNRKFYCRRMLSGHPLLTIIAGIAIIIFFINSLFPPYGWDAFKSTFPRALALLEGEIIFPRHITHPMFMEFFLYGLWQSGNFSFEEIWIMYPFWKPVTSLVFPGIVFFFIGAAENKKLNSVPFVMVLGALFIPIYWKHTQLLYSNLTFAFLVLALFIFAGNLSLVREKKPGIYELFFLFFWGMALCQVRRLAPLYILFIAAYYFFQRSYRNIMRTTVLLCSSLGFLVWHWFVRGHEETTMVVDVVETLPRRVTDPHFSSLIWQNAVYFGSSVLFSLKDSIGGRTAEEYLFFWIVLLASFILRPKKLVDWYPWLFLAALTLFFIFLTWVTLPWNIWYSINRYYLPIFTLLYYNEIKNGG